MRTVLDTVNGQYWATIQLPAGEQRFRAIAEGYFVAADAAEEIGDRNWARAIRGYARRFLILDWMRRREPDHGVLVADVVAIDDDPRPEVEITRFIVYPPRTPSHPFLVAVDRRGRPRLLKRTR